MKHFIYKIFLFCILIVIVIAGAEIYLKNIPSLYEQKRDQFLTKTDSIEVLILGNSHGMYGINPNQLSLFAYNLATEGQGTYYDNALLNKYLSIMPNLKYVILCIDIHNLCLERSGEVEFFYKKYYDISFKNRTYYKEFFLESFFVYNPEHAVSLIMKDLKHEPKKNIGEKGWMGSPINQSSDLNSEAKNRLKADVFNDELANYYKNDMIGYLENAIETLQSNNIRPILITCPIYFKMRSLLDKRILERIGQAANYLSQKYDIIYLDYTDDERFEIEDFFDSDHLNTTGAEKLTQRLDSVIEKLEYSRKLDEK
jgi:hypothetical protein